MEKHLKKRLVGAFVTVVALAIVIPAIVDGNRANLTLDNDMPPMPALPEWTEVDNQKRIRIDLEELASGKATEKLMPPSEDLTNKSESLPAKKPKDKVATDEKGLPFAWTIQVGAFSDRKNAIALQNRFRNDGFKSYIRSDRDGLVRVFVGPEIKREDIDQLQASLKKRTGQTYYIKRYQAR
ncbi:MAG: SPOR domain-containing protein [Oceanobacter sp.]